MWKKYVRDGQATGDNIIRRMRFACWVPKATNKHSEYVILNDFSTATMVAQTRLNVTLYVHYLYCFKYTSLHTALTFNHTTRHVRWRISSSLWRIFKNFLGGYDAVWSYRRSTEDGSNTFLRNTVSTYKTTRCHHPEDHVLNLHDVNTRRCNTDTNADLLITAGTEYFIQIKSEQWNQTAVKFRLHESGKKAQWLEARARSSPPPAPCGIVAGGSCEWSWESSCSPQYGPGDWIQSYIQKETAPVWHDNERSLFGFLFISVSSRALFVSWS